ncbi:MAG: hypothetical protein QXK37_03190 [Candidatus Woesearchaeota archaeon]
MIDIEKLRKKLEPHEVKNIEDIIKNPKEKHSAIIRPLNLFIYWTSLLVLGISNFFASFLLIPTMLFLNGIRLYVIVIVFGLILGTLFTFLLQGMEHMERKFHIIALIFMPLLGVADISIMASVVKKISAEIGNVQIGSISVIISLYVFSFILPYIVFILLKGWRSKEDSNEAKHAA